MQAKKAASLGSSRSRCSRMLMMMEGVNGARLARFEDGGARAVAPSNMALSSLAWTSQGSPCNKCHALSAAA